MGSSVGMKSAIDVGAEVGSIVGSRRDESIGVVNGVSRDDPSEMLGFSAFTFA